MKVTLAISFIVLLTLVEISATARHHERDQRLSAFKRRLNMNLVMRERRSKPTSDVPKKDSKDIISNLSDQQILSNEINAPPETKALKGVTEDITRQKLTKAMQWVMGERGRDWGWGQDTAHTVLSLALANSSWFSEKNLEAQLVIKQFELDLVLRLWKHKDTPLSTGHLALNIMALVSLCRDPRSFYSKDLVALLEHEEGGVDFEIAFSQLATCTAGKHVRKNRVRRLLDIIGDQERLHSVDTLSVVILALHCAQRQRHHDLHHYIDEAILALLKHQGSDGAFSNNLHTTALSLQAMSVSELDDSWNATRAQEYIMSHQRPVGSFGNLFDTNAVLPLLGGRTILDVALQPCHRDIRSNIDTMDVQDTYAFASIEPPTSKLPPKENSKLNSVVNTTVTPQMINMTYIIWIGKNASINYNLTLTVTQNTSFFSIMKMAASKDKRFEFAASKWLNGYYIHTLAGRKEQMTGYRFWLLYRLFEPPVPGVEPDIKFAVGTGVKEIFPNNGDYILYWYHKV